jgi:glycosyltransferase involved in cell wall biosynthesis
MKVSVIIPTFNRANYIVRAVKSVLAQTYKHYEIIVIDDGSTDETRHILEPYSQCVRYVYQDNAGPAAARNNGISGRREWLAFLDSDDIWLPQKLEIQLSHCINLNADLCFHDLSFSNSCGENIASWNEYVHKGQLSLLPLKTGILSDAYQRMMTTGHLFLTTTFLVKGSVIHDVGYFNKDYRTSEDLELYFRLAARYRVAYISEALAVYSPGTHRVTDKERIYVDRINAIKNSLADRLKFEDTILAHLAKKGLLQETRNLAGSYRSAHYYYKALRTYLQYILLRNKPLNKSAQ